MNIKLIFIPPGKTYKFQPLDVGVHLPLKSCPGRLCKEAIIKNSDIKMNMNH